MLDQLVLRSEPEMQDRYAGDIGDFVKLGLLRAISPGYALGLAWYHVPDEGTTMTVATLATPHSRKHTLRLIHKAAVRRTVSHVCFQERVTFPKHELIGVD